jgi:hypothetical protein
MVHADARLPGELAESQGRSRLAPSADHAAGRYSRRQRDRAQARDGVEVMNGIRRIVPFLLVAATSVSPSLGQPAPSGGPVACRDEIGPAAAKRLAAQCRDASPASHPPCNVANPCAMMRAEVARSCQLFAASRPLPADLCAAGRAP